MNNLDFIGNYSPSSYFSSMQKKKPPAPTPAPAPAQKQTTSVAPPPKPPKPTTGDIRQAKKGEVWVATWFSGYGGADDYITRDYTIKDVKDGKIYTENESAPINVGTIWKRKNIVTGGKKTKKKQTKKRKPDSKNKRRMKKTASKR